MQLEIVKDKFPDWFSFTLRSISRDLKKKGLAMYGYEAELKLSSDIFSREDAEEALRAAEEMFEACSRLIKGIFSEKRESK